MDKRFKKYNSSILVKVIAFLWLLGGIVLSLYVYDLLDQYRFIDDDVKTVAVIVIMASAVVRFAMIISLGDIVSYTAKLTQIFEEARERRTEQK